jgi:hypothetical protein
LRLGIEHTPGLRPGAVGARCQPSFIIGPLIIGERYKLLTADLAAHNGWATFYPTKDDRGKSYHTLVIHLPGLQRTDVGTTTAGDGFMNLPD